MGNYLTQRNMTQLDCEFEGFLFIFSMYKWDNELRNNVLTL